MENKIIVFSNELKKQMRNKRTHAIKSLFIIGFIFFINIMLNLIWYNQSNGTLFMTITIIILLLGGWLTIYSILEQIIPINRALKLFETIGKSISDIKTATVIEWDSEVVTIHGLPCNKVRVYESGKFKVYYLLQSQNTPVLLANTVISFTVFDLLITTIQVGDQQ